MNPNFNPFFGKEPSPKQLEAFNKFQEVVYNVLTSRQEFIRQYFDPRRDIYDECGYPSNQAPIDIELYKRMYERDGIAQKAVNFLAEESWQVCPTVYEEEDIEVETEFELAWKQISKDLSGDMFFKEEEGNRIWEYLQRVDNISGVGRYGILLLGLSDGKQLSEPVLPQEGMKLLYVRCLPEYMAEVSTLNSDPTSPRFGMPETYNVSFTDYDNQEAQESILLTHYAVHHSRVIHVADNLTSSEVYGTPRMKTVYNRLHDLQKLYGGSAEMYWRGAFPGLAIETDPTLGGQVEVDIASTKTELEQYMNSLQRYLLLNGLQAKSLAPQVVDPTPQIEVQIDAICAALDIPKRIFMGSERGELASSQDRTSWKERVRKRQNGYITPRIICPLIVRLIQLRVLPTPAQYCVEWPDITAQGEAEQVEIGLKRSQALQSYLSSGGDSVASPTDFLTRFLGFTEQEALAMLEATEEYLDTVLAEKKEELEETQSAIDNPPPAPPMAV